MSSSNMMESSISSKTTINIEGILVDFPYNPYPCQVEYMTKNIIALKFGHNSLLESPTGTGKTLCLLCSTLAWQNSLVKKQKIKLEYSSEALSKSLIKNAKEGIKGNDGGSNDNSSIIIYASRTHSQLTQVVNELRKTEYKPKLSVLGSREQLCVNTKINKLKSGLLNHACKTSISSHSCLYKNNLDTAVGNNNINIIRDIEDLKKMGTEDKICSYYFSQDSSKNADLILLPYNYLLDNSIRSTLNINWSNSIIIFDEAHNLEKIASDAASFSITAGEIGTCIKELQTILQDTIDSSKTNIENDTKFSSEKLPNKIIVVRLLKSLFEIEKRIDAIPLLATGPGKTKSVVLPGNWLVTTFESCGLNHIEIFENVGELRKCSIYLLDKLSSALGQNSSSPIAEPKVASLGKALQKIFKTGSKIENEKNSLDYKVFINEEEEKKDFNRSKHGVTIVNHSKKKWIINYWAFSPGIAMEELKKLGIRSIVLTSGTLSPLDAFKEDMKINFPITLENPHVINTDQIWVGALSVGSTGKQLNSSYKIRETEDYKDELGISILQICQTMIGRGGIGSTPAGPELKGGVLVFFPSYGILDSSIVRWKETGCFNKLQVAGGAVIIEPRTSSINPQKNNYNNKFKSNNQNKSPQNSKFDNNNDNNSDEENEETDDIQLSGIVKEFEYTLQRNGRCILLAVCRGKVSEGIDFRDQKGRVVIITGLPYAPHLDPWVILKRMYLDEKIKISNCNQYNSSSSSYNNSMYTSTSNPYTSILATKSETVPYESVMKIQPVSNPYSNPYATQLVMAPPASPPKVISNFAISKQNNSTPLKLDGQGWYNQSASRAVNQAMGRIIRHKSDWGAIFLLDDRFQNDKQKAQLSSWLRSSMTKHNKYMPALQQFRNFITHCMNDPNLNLISEYESLVPINMPRPKKPIISNEISMKNDLNKFTRQVIVDSNKLQSGEDNNYIDPSLLLTQKETDYEDPSDSNIFDDDMDDLDYNEFNLNNIISKMKPAKNNNKSIVKSSSQVSYDISDLFANSSVLVKGNSLSGENGYKPPVPNNFISNINTNKNFISLNKPASFSNNIGLSDKKNFSINDDDDDDDNDNNDYNQQHIDKKHINTGLRKHSIGLSSNSTTIEVANWNKKSSNKVIFGLSSSSSSSSSSATNINTIDIKENNISNNIKNELMKIVGLIKNKLSSENFIEFNKLHVNIKKNEISGVTQLRDFTSKLMVIFKDIGLKEKEEILLSLKILLPSSLIDIYTSMIKKTCQRPINKSQPPSSTVFSVNKDNIDINKIKPSLNSFLNGNSKVADIFKLIRQPDINNPSIINSTTSKNITSSSSSSSNNNNLTNKRPISEVLSNNSTANISQNQKPKTENKTNESINISRIENKVGIKSNINEITNNPMIINNNNTNSNAQSVMAPKANNFLCPICNEIPTTPCAAKTCGHVCCATCWLKWLKNKESCPICRTFTTTKSITKIIIK